MSYVALATDDFDAVVEFYGDTLRLPLIAEWDRANGRGQRFDLGGMTLEVLDNGRERSPLAIHSPGERFHLVIEVEDAVGAHLRLGLDTPPPEMTSWGARVFQLRDPDGIPVTFLEWADQSEAAHRTICGRVVTGAGVASGFTQLDWVRAELVGKLGIDPHPGTLNARLVDAQSRAIWSGLRATPGIPIDPPSDEAESCGARCFPVEIHSIGRAAIVLPDVEDYPADQIEVIAEAGVRDELGIVDGDLISVALSSAQAPAGHRERSDV